jgi:hypothetical protein
MMMGSASAGQAVEQVAAPELIGIDRQVIAAHTDALVRGQRTNSLLRTACWTAAGAVGLGMCYTLFKDCSWTFSGEHEALQELAKSINEVREKINIAEHTTKKANFWLVLWRKIYNTALPAITIGTATCIAKAVFQDHSLEGFLDSRSSFKEICKNIEQLGYVVHAMESAPHVYTQARITMVYVAAVHAYNNLMRDIERVLGYIEFQLHHHMLQHKTLRTDGDLITFIVNDLERSVDTMQGLITRFETAQHEQDKISALMAVYEHLLVYKNMFQLLLDTFDCYEKQVAKELA